VANLEGFQCETCGNWHDGLPLDYGYAAPHYWTRDLSSRPDCFLNADFCVLRNEHFFVRGLIEIPVLPGEDFFRYGAWISLSKKNFDRMRELWHPHKLLIEPPYFGWLSNSIDLYPETLNLKASVSSRVITQRPFITLEATDHPLALEQGNGISIDRVREMAELRLHTK
jgi:hypothetical protein